MCDDRGMTQPPAEITVDQLPADAVLLDVREDNEWAAGHAPGATHVPLAEVPQRLADLPDADPLYVICRSGGRSSRAADWLNGQGVAAVNVDGGMLRWESLGRAMDNDGSDAPTVL